MRKHITLPALQFATAAFFITTCHAEWACVDAASNAVDISKCDGKQPAGDFFLIKIDAHIDSTDAVGRESAGLPGSGLVTGGFGKRQDCGGEGQPACGSGG